MTPLFELTDGLRIRFAIKLEEMVLSNFKARAREFEILLVPGTPHEQNCVVLVRVYHDGETLEDRENGWTFIPGEVPTDISYACKTWWNHYQQSVPLQQFIDNIL